ncbi:MAG: response regulator [Gemmataceae bacterium]|nr:response regulator [Gemmataceae bacterium]
MVIVDEAGVIECIGPSAATAFGYSADDLLGKPSHQILDIPNHNGIHRNGTRFPLRLTQYKATAIEGSGLGLVLSRHLVEFMGGSLTFASEMGVGTTFTIELSVSQRVPAPRDHPADTSGTRVVESKSNFVLLLIEDNLANVQFIEAVLDFRPGVQMITAAQGSVGLELARKHIPDLILLDVHLPDMRGVEVLAALRANPLVRDIPVVIVSADATKHQIDLLYKAGACEYLTKPIDVDRFLRVIDNFRMRI